MIQPESLTTLLADAADRAPDRVALREQGRSITWADADVRAGRLAGALAAVGVSPGDRVGVHHRKSAESFLAMHAVVRLGAIAVPLDPTASTGYLNSIVNATGCEVVVSHDQCRASATVLADAGGVRALVGVSPGPEPARGLTEVGPADVAELSPSPPTSVAPDQVAYLITTSGSTGRPKAITHTHRSAAAHIAFMTTAYDLTAEDRVSDIAPSHFDISTLALWVTPAVTASNVVIPEPYQMLPASLSQLAADEAVSVWYSVPYLLTQLLARGSLGDRDLSALRLVLFGGEVFPPQVLADLMAELPGARFSNVYGPAEVNACTVYDLPGPPDPAGGPIPIGRPVAGTEVRVVPLEGRPTVVPGEQGELWVRAETMMTGYWKRPDLDRSVLVEGSVLVDDSVLVEGTAGGDDAEATSEPGRWYRTGDLGWIRADGELVFAGRVDHQVKVRGRRVELEAIEAVLEAVPGIASAVAAVARTDSGDDIVIAGVTSDDGTTLDLVQVGHDCHQHLPAYAVPVTIHALDSAAGPTPLTGSGKLDRRAVRAQLLDRHNTQEL